MQKLVRSVLGGLARIYLFPLYWLSGLWPRHADVWVFGSGTDRAKSGDAAALFDYWSTEGGNMLKPVWLSGDYDTVLRLRQQGRRAYMRWSPGGMYYALAAAQYIYDCFPNEANYWLSRGATRICLWSGGTVRRRLRQAENQSDADYRLFRGGPMQRLTGAFMRPWRLIHPNLVIAGSADEREMLGQAFDLPQTKIAITGYPRNDAVLQAVSGYTDPAVPEGMEAAVDAGRKVFLFAPSVRGNGDSCMGVEWERLDKLIGAAKGHLLVSLEEGDPLELPDGLRHIERLDSSCNVREMFPHIDALIGDYSGLMTDFLLTHRPTIHYVPDLDEMAVQRHALNYRLRDLAAGPVCFSFRQLLAAIVSVCVKEEQMRARAEASTALLRMHSYNDGRACRRVLWRIQDDFHLIPLGSYLELDMPTISSGGTARFSESQVLAIVVLTIVATVLGSVVFRMRGLL